MAREGAGMRNSVPSQTLPVMLTETHLLPFVPLHDLLRGRSSKVVEWLLGDRKGHHYMMTRLLRQRGLEHTMPAYVHEYESRLETDWHGLVAGFMRNRCSKNDFVRKMYRSIVRGKLDVAEKYAVAGGNLDFQLPNEEGAWTALHHACTIGNMCIVTWLLARNVDVSKRDVNGCTPLQQAAHNGHKEVVAALLEQGGSQIDVTDNLGQTALWYASWHGRINVIELLVTTGGADTSIRANNGTTAREVAELNPMNRGGCPAVARWLQSHDNQAANSIANSG